MDEEDQIRVDLNDRNEAVITALKANLVDTLEEVLESSFVTENDNRTDEEIDFIFEVTIDVISTLFINHMVLIARRSAHVKGSEFLLFEGVLRELKKEFNEQFNLRKMEVN